MPHNIAVIGLGYVGLPIAIAFAQHVPVIGFDISPRKIECLRKGIDPTAEVGNEAVKSTTMFFTDDEKDLQKADFHIVAVPTPINMDKTPDLTPIIEASKVVGRNLAKGSIVVYESTVYPGVTEEICVPILIEESGLRYPEDFRVGYSPERINPGDKVHRLDNIVKIVSGCDEKTLDTIAKVYEIVVKTGVHKASSIKVAEAAKVAENSQRDINIAFMNELAMVFSRMGISTLEVVSAMNTKWNALGFTPGLVGGHCIGVDPYYFIYQAERLGTHSQLILSGRQINEGMSSFVVDQIIRKLILAGKVVRECKVAIFGITFKENCPDIRNSKVVDVYRQLKSYGLSPLVHDPWADEEEVREECGIDLTAMEQINNIDCAIFAVCHEAFKALSPHSIDAMYSSQDTKLMFDLKGVLQKDEIEKYGILVWNL